MFFTISTKRTWAYVMYTDRVRSCAGGGGGHFEMEIAAAIQTNYRR